MVFERGLGLEIDIELHHSFLCIIRPAARLFYFHPVVLFQCLGPSARVSVLKW